MTVEKQVAEILLDLKCVDFNFNELFTYTSGMKSPIYTNCRLLISYPEERDKISGWMANLIKDNVKLNKNTLICGLASAGIPHAAWVAEKLNIGMVYARDKPKEHGLRKIIEGRNVQTLPIVIVEDHITTGKSILEEANALRTQGGTVEYAFSIFTYKLKIANDKLQSAGIKSYSLCDIDVLLDLALKRGNITEKQKNDIIIGLNKYIS